MRIQNLFISALIIITVSRSLKLNAQNNCSCWKTVDTTNGWHVVPFALDSDGDLVPSPPLYRNDDGVSNPIKLPFNFCFWGKTIDTVYINNNGDISFGQSYSSYNPAGFPLVGWEMIAPFWADVDTRNASSGVVYYKLTSTYLIVQWDTVGYYSEHVDKLNSFQVIISNGHDPIIPNGNNVEVCYGSMQWTTGDASNGVNGFDGSPADPATVGVNAGDGHDYIQFGLFGVPGNSYLGQYPPFPYDGVSWLDGKSFIFNVCNNNTPPIVSGISPCDTLIVCIGDTLDVPVLFLSPNQNDTSKSGLTPPVLSGVSIIRNVPGTTDSVLLQIVGNGLNYGFHNINLYGYVSNVNPHDTSFAQFVLEVIPQPKPVISGNDSVCIGGNTILTGNGGFVSYTWSNGATTSSISVNPVTQTTYTLTVSNGICQHDTTITIYIKPNPIPTITARPDSICAGDSSTLTANGGGTYAWSNPPGGSRQTVRVAAGTYTVAVTKNGCTHDTTITVVPLSNTPPSIGLTLNNLCPNDSTVLQAAGGTKYKWMPGGDSTANIKVDPGTSTIYTCTITTPCRVIDTTISVTYKPWPNVGISGDTSICLGNSTTITASGGGTYNWNNNQFTSSILVAPLKDSVFTVQVTLNGCSKDTSIQINVHTVPHVTITPSNKVCIGVPFTLTASGACDYKWSNGATTSSITVTPGSTTTFSVAAWCYNDTTGCDTALSSQITVDAAKLNACCDTTIVSGDTASLTGNGSNNYMWSPNFGLSCDNCPNPIATPTVTTTYTVSSIDTSNGCTHDTIIVVTVNRPCNNIYAPNVFTPNNDGINDDFVVSVDTLSPSGERSSWSNFTFYSIAIFDRWGKEVYTSTDPAQPWNGRISNTQDLVPDGVYYYIIKTTCGANNNEKKGFVEVLGEK